MPITETLTWYTPDEKMPEKKSDVLIKVKNCDGEDFTLEVYFNIDDFYIEATEISYEVSEIILWAYMPKGVGNE